MRDFPEIRVERVVIKTIARRIPLKIQEIVLLPFHSRRVAVLARRGVVRDRHALAVVAQSIGRMLLAWRSVRGATHEYKRGSAPFQERRKHGHWWRGIGLQA